MVYQRKQLINSSHWSSTMQMVTTVSAITEVKTLGNDDTTFVKCLRVIPRGLYGQMKNATRGVLTWRFDLWRWHKYITWGYSHLWWTGDKFPSRVYSYVVCKHMTFVWSITKCVFMAIHSMNPVNYMFHYLVYLCGISLLFSSEWPRWCSNINMKWKSIP